MASAPRPNIVIIMADDMGYSDIGCFGGEIATPHIDRMAAQGLRFTQFYNASRCCPSRASLLTGLYAHQTGIGHMSHDYGRPAYRGFLNRQCVTIAEALRQAGYWTMMTGKWHVGEAPAHWPRRRGFHRYYGTPQGGGHYFGLMKGRSLVLDDAEVAVPPGWYATDAFNDQACRFLDEAAARKQPFFLYVAHIAPHYPLHARPEDIARYRDTYRIGWDEVRRRRYRRQLEMGVIDRRWPLSPRDRKAKPWEKVVNKERWQLRMAIYAAQVDCMDRGIGRILAKLRDIGAEDNTLVLFLSDNGGCSAEVRRSKPGAQLGTGDSYESYGLAWANASNTPFRRYKRWEHEGGIATPLVARWPAVIKHHGAITHEPGHIIDLMATCVDVAGATYPTEHDGHAITPLEGKNLRPILEGRTRTGAAAHQALFWEHEGNRAVRQGQWKLVLKHPDTAWELYDLAADRTELHNLAAQYPDRVAAMADLYDGWATRVGAVPWREARTRRP